MNLFETLIQLNHIWNKEDRANYNPGSEFVAANTLAKWKKLELNEIDFNWGFSQKVV